MGWGTLQQKLRGLYELNTLFYLVIKQPERVKAMVIVSATFLFRPGEP